MTQTKLWQSQNSEVLTVTSEADEAGLDLGDEMTKNGFWGVLLGGHVVDDDLTQSDKSEMTELEYEELVDAVRSTRRQQILRRPEGE